MTIKKKLLLPLIFLSSLTAGQASSLTLVSGFTNFTKDKNGAIKSNVGAQLTLTPGAGTIEKDGSFTTVGSGGEIAIDPADKTSINLSSLKLSGAEGGTGYTININFNTVSNLHNLNSLFGLSTQEAPIDNIVARGEIGNLIGIADNGSSENRPNSALSTTINFKDQFTLTLSVEAGGAYSLFIRQGGTTQILTWEGATQAGVVDHLILGSWSGLDQYNAAVNISSIGIYSGAATIDNLPPNLSVPEPTTASLGLLGLTALLLRRRRAVA